MFRTISLLLVATLLSSCGGIPLRSMPRLMSLQSTVLEMNPAEFRLAIQADQRMMPPAGAVPEMHLVMRPREAGSFDAVDKTLRMRSMVIAGDTGRGKGLPPATARRRWLIYSFPPQSQAELARLQQHFKRIQAQQQGRGGGSIAVGIAQAGIAAKDPALAATRWESWLQTSEAEGYYALWSGTVADLLRQAQRSTP